MHGREGYSTAGGVFNSGVVESVFRGDANEVHFQQGGKMRGIVNVLEIGESMLDQQRHQTGETKCEKPMLILRPLAKPRVTI